MAFGDFGFPQVLTDLGLGFAEADLFSGVEATVPRGEFIRVLAAGTDLALAINSEKAKSEFMIAPLLLELRQQLEGAFALFSGIELNVDPSRGLNGVCDFIISGSSRQFFLSAPLVTIVEVKNDNPRNGLGQCIASMVAASLFNAKAGSPVDAVFGAVTTGSDWRFLKMEGTTVTIDLREYYIADPGKILGIIRSIVEAGGRPRVSPATAP